MASVLSDPSLAQLKGMRRAALLVNGWDEVCASRLVFLGDEAVQCIRSFGSRQDKTVLALEELLAVAYERYFMRVDDFVLESCRFRESVEKWLRMKELGGRSALVSNYELDSRIQDTYGVMRSLVFVLDSDGFAYLRRSMYRRRFRGRVSGLAGSVLDFVSLLERCRSTKENFVKKVW